MAFVICTKNPRKKPRQKLDDMGVDYNHSANLHTLSGPLAALPVLFANNKPASLLDVGCGAGTWLKAALDLGIPDVCGVDGVEIPPEKLHVPAGKIRHQDLTQPWHLGKKFDLVLCLEVAEHLDNAFAQNLIDSLVEHGERICFSAACPGQGGQHHVNCQQPAYWQKLFNDRGFVCEDSLRWQIWDDARIEPWYRQNLFCARKDPARAGTEPRIAPVVHPAMSNVMWQVDTLGRIKEGRMSVAWYMGIPFFAFKNKLFRKLSKRRLQKTPNK
jgi:SAM-dependent methyltransferase